MSDTPTTIVIFATEKDASPLILLDGYRDEEIAPILCRMQRDEFSPKQPGAAAIEFLRALSPDETDEFNPRLESTPIFCVGGVAEVFNDHSRDSVIAWDPETWEEWDLSGNRPVLRASTKAQARDLAEQHYSGKLAFDEAAAYGEYCARLRRRGSEPMRLDAWRAAGSPTDDLGSLFHVESGAAPGACILHVGNMHTSEDCTLHDHEPPREISEWAFMSPGERAAEDEAEREAAERAAGRA